MADWRKNAVHTVEVTGYTAEGLGVARLEGRVIFIPGTIRGESWQVQLLKVRTNVAWAKGVKLLVPSPERLEPDCPLAGRCGGCQYRHMTYREELEAKRQRVQDALTRVGGASLELPPVLGAELPLRYRNKVQFPVARERQGLAVGYYRARSHDVLDVEDCLLQPEGVTALRRAFKNWMERYRVPAYDEGSGSGLIRHLYVRTNQKGEALCCVVANGRRIPHAPELVQALRQAEPALAGLVLNTNTRDTNVILGPDYRTVWGQDFLEEELCGMTFRLSVPSFFQINRAQTERLYEKALEFAALTGQETVLDLYCGIGTISLALARRAGQVIGAEIVPEAIEDAEANARRNGVANVRFLCGDAGQAAFQLAQEGVRRDLCGPAPEGPGPGGAGGPGLHGPGADRLCVLRLRHPGPGCEALRSAGLPGGAGRGRGEAGGKIVGRRCTQMCNFEEIPRIGRGRKNCYEVPKHRRTAQAAAKKPVRSAHRAAGMAYRVLDTPTAPK